MFENEQQKASWKAAKAKIKADKKAFKQGLHVETGYEGGVGNINDQGADRLVEGVINMAGGDFRRVFVEGVLNTSGALTAELLDVSGVANFNGDLKVGDFACEGTINIRGDVKAEQVGIEGVVNVNSGKLEATEINCDGVLRVKQGEVSADRIDAEGSIWASQIVGDQVRICNKYKSSFWTSLLNSFGPTKVDLIEATDIHLEKVVANQVNGEHIEIGPKCEIDHVDCSGTLHVDPSATVGSITGDCRTV
ncbi:MAG: hypothetical protein LBL67_04195 [Coriobacteriales bacterium]|jgi:cytoskeletal protein CcmA (bactofilin family)|nr:hypothetical protein [Coriobacteriales bacterium]